LAAQPYVSIEALAALSALLDLALKDQTPSAILLSGASGASHDQRPMSRVTRHSGKGYRDDRARSIRWIYPGAACQTTPPARPAWPELPAEARAALTSLMRRFILDHVAATATPRAKEADHDL